MTTASASTSGHAPRCLLFVLKNGPIYSLEDHIAHQLAVLSQELDCELWSRGDIEVDSYLYPDARVRIVKSAYRPSRIAMARYLISLMRRTRELARKRPDSVIILAHDPLRSGLFAWLMSRWAGVPFIVEINGVYANLDNYGVSEVTWKTRLRIALFKLIGRFVLARASAVRLLFQDQLQGFAPLGEHTAQRTFFDITSIDRFHDEGEQKVVLFVGFPFHTKGVDILIQAFEQVCGEFPDWKLLLVGHDLADSVAKVCSNPRVTVVRAMSNEELAPIVNKSGIFVLPSRSEAMGRVLLEAAAASKPRIASRVGGIPQVLRHNEDGLLFEKGNVTELASHLRALMGSPELRKKFGVAARRRIETEFSDPAYLRHMTEMIDAAFKAYAHEYVSAERGPARS